MQSQIQLVKAGAGVVNAAKMVDSSSLLHDGQIEAARNRLARDGYLLLRGFLPAAELSQVLLSFLLGFPITSAECNLLYRHELFC